MKSKSSLMKSNAILIFVTIIFSFTFTFNHWQKTIHFSFFMLFSLHALYVKPFKK